jgi:dissimilatory sulfite reductase (desulfoviridin) alpha/beta subunit
MNRETYRIQLCWGVESGKCRNLVHRNTQLHQKLEPVIASSGWPECLAGNLSRPIRPLDQFSISVSGCPNGCSRPQIADFGLLQALRPRVDEEGCTGCGECVHACREEAIELENGTAGINPGLCLACGKCVRACPEGALYASALGYRVQVGGKLGRHPRLADELPGIQSEQEVLHILASCLQLHQGCYRPGVRFGQVVAEQGLGRIGGLANEH